MHLSERQEAILQLVRQNGGTLSSTELTRNFNVSVQTIRKDLNDLSDLGLVKRIHGGVTLPVQNHNLSFSNRQVINLEAKKKIAKKVAESLPEGCSVFIGIGTTPQQVAQELYYHSGLTVITNNLNAALALCHNPNIDTYVTGGKLRHSDQDLTGEDTTQFIRRFEVNFGVFGVGGISEHGTLLDFTPEESHISKAIMENCEHRYLVADQSKFQRSAAVKTGQLADIDKFYTDRLPESLWQKCHEAQIEVIECAAENQAQVSQSSVITNKKASQEKEGKNL